MTAVLQPTANHLEPPNGMKGYKTDVFKIRLGDFPGGAVVKNPPASAGDTGSSPGLGRPPHLSEQLSPCATTTEGRRLGARAPQQEATAMRSPRTTTKSSPRSPQLEKALVQQRRPNAAKSKN